MSKRHCRLSVVRMSSLTFHFFDFIPETAEQNVLYQVCVFSCRSETKIFALACNLLRCYWLLLCNRYTEFNDTSREAKSQCPLSCLCFSDRSKNKDCRPGLLMADTFSTSSQNCLSRIQLNLAGIKISTSCLRSRIDRKTKMAAIASNWLNYFRLYHNQILKLYFTQVDFSNSCKILKYVKY